MFGIIFYFLIINNYNLKSKFLSISSKKIKGNNK